MENEFIQIDHTSLHNQQVLRCPKCHSVFVENDKCESCDYNLNFDHLGEPLGIKSYFSLKEEYLNERSLVLNLFPIFKRLITPSSDREFERKLIFRFELLLKYLDDYYENANKYKLYVLEVEQIIEELQKLGYNSEFILEKIQSHYVVQHPFFQEISHFLLNQDLKVPSVYSESIRLLKYIFGLVSLVFLALMAYTFIF